MSEAGVHRPHVAGIHGREEDGAFSIVLSGGYEDDAVSHGHSACNIAFEMLNRKTGVFMDMSYTCNIAFEIFNRKTGVFMDMLYACNIAIETFIRKTSVYGPDI